MTEPKIPLSSTESQAITSKICSKCGFIKPLAAGYFHKDISNKNGFKSWCSDCSLRYDIENREVNRARSKRNYLKNREIERKRGKLKYEKNRKAIRAKYKTYYLENKEKIDNKNKLYAANNKNKTNKRVRNRHRTDSKFRLNNLMRSGVRKSLKNGTKNGRKWESLVDFTADQLESKLKHSVPKGWKYQDFLDGKLHIDHKIPIAKFNFKSPEDPDFKRCWSLNNLQLLPAKENLSKKDKLKKPMQMCLAF